jgi:hypothetical protein
MLPDSHLSGHHHRILDQIFEHPEPANLHWLDVVGLVGVLGEVEEKHDGKFLFRIGARQDTFHKPHSKALTLPELRQLRAFLKNAGVEPGSPEPTAATDSTLAQHDAVVVIDHHQTRIFALDGDHAAATLRPYDPDHFLHHLAHKDQPHYRGQRAPEDLHYYDRIADALKDVQRVLVVSHGKGESDAGAILLDRLRKKHGDVYARTARQAHVDTSALSDAQLLELAKQEFARPA